MRRGNRAARLQNLAPERVERAFGPRLKASDAAPAAQASPRAFSPITFDELVKQLLNLVVLFPAAVLIGAMCRGITTGKKARLPGSIADRRGLPVSGSCNRSLAFIGGQLP
jgi:hypothetical protein